MKFVVAFVMCIVVAGWAVRIIVSYLYDAVHGYGGPTPMALDTSICFLLLAIALGILSKYRIKDH